MVIWFEQADLVLYYVRVQLHKWRWWWERRRRFRWLDTSTNKM